MGNGTAGQPLFSGAGSAATLTVTTTDPMKIAAAGVGEGSLGNTNAQDLADLSTASIAGGTSGLVLLCLAAGSGW